LSINKHTAEAVIDELNFEKQINQQKYQTDLFYLFVVNVAKSNIESFDVRIGSTRAATKRKRM
jgi:hypothetical protein